MRHKIILIIVCLFIPILFLSFLAGCNILGNQIENSSYEEKLGGLNGLFISQKDNSAYCLQENGMYQSGIFDKDTGVLTVAWECIYTVKGSDVKLYNVPEDSQSTADWIAIGGAKIINGKVETVSGYTSYNKSFKTDRSKLKTKFDLRKLGIMFGGGPPDIENRADGSGVFQGTWTRATKDVSFEMKPEFDMEGNPYGYYKVWMPYNIFDENDPKYFEFRGSCEATATELIIYDGNNKSRKTVCPRNGYTFYIPADNVFGDPMFEGMYFPAAGRCKFYPIVKEELTADTTQAETTETPVQIPADTSTESLLVGKWFILKDDTGGSVYWEFQEGGVILMYGEGGSTNMNVAEGTYTLSGKKLYINVSAPSGESGGYSKEFTIVSITNDSMTIASEGETHTITKVK